MSSTDGITLLDTQPRMKDRLTPDDLNTSACVELAATVLKEAAEAYKQALRNVRIAPRDKIAREHLKTCRDFYRSDWFKALSCGMVDGEAVMRELEKEVGE